LVAHRFDAGSGKLSGTPVRLAGPISNVPALTSPAM